MSSTVCILTSVLDDADAQRYLIPDHDDDDDYGVGGGVLVDLAQPDIFSQISLGGQILLPDIRSAPFFNLPTAIFHFYKHQVPVPSRIGVSLEY